MSLLFRLLSPSLRKRSRLRSMIRGYARLRVEGRIGLERHIKSVLADRPILGIDTSASPLIFGAAIGNAERVVRQYLFEHHVGRSMNRAILFALGNKSAIVFALPRLWRQVLIEHKLDVNASISAIAWRWELLMHFGRNIFSMVLIMSRILGVQGQSIPRDRYAYFEGLSAGNLPQLDRSNGPGYDICNWYAQLGNRNRNIAAIRHGVSQRASEAGGLLVEPISAPFLLLRGSLNILRLWAWCCLATLQSAFDLLRGRWWNALLLAEAMRAKAVSLCSDETLADEYLFHFSCYRPLWTYEAEHKGSRIVCYFYSTFEQAKLVTGYESQKFEWGGATWPLYLVWDEYQKAQLRRDLGDAPAILEVGPIWFSAGPMQLELAASTVAVFDVEAPRISAHFPLSTAGEYIAAHPDLSARFLHDVQYALAEQGLTMAFKKKRNIGERGSKKYKKLVLEIASAKNVVLVEPHVSGLQLIEKCAAVISMPFTSTALYLRERNKPSVYYDPTGWIQRDDRAAHGIPVLIGVEELRCWISNVLTAGRA